MLEVVHYGYNKNEVAILESLMIVFIMSIIQNEVASLELFMSEVYTMAIIKT